MDVAYTLKKVVPIPETEETKTFWLYVSMHGGIPEGHWVNKWTFRTLIENRDKAEYWKNRMGGKIVIVRRKPVSP